MKKTADKRRHLPTKKEKGQEGTDLKKREEDMSGDSFVTPSKKVDDARENTSYHEELALLKELVRAKSYKDPDMRSADLAAKLKIPKYHIGPLIKAAGFKDFPTFLNHHRIGEACRLLDEGPEMNMKDIYYEVGFKSKQHFLRSFQKLKGCSPTHYKQKK
jgi:AraC-like DNA-binding protein